MNDDWLGSSNLALAIVRVSTKGQERNYSPETQEQEIREYCGRHRLEIKQVFRIAESAKDSDNRKLYGEAINFALTQNVRHLLFHMFDRETRNLTDNEKNEKLVKADLICIHYVREHKVLHKDSPDSDFFLRDIQAAGNKQFIRNLKAKVVDAMKQKAESGCYPSNNVPLGYALKRPVDDRGREMKRGSIVIPNPDAKKVKQVTREFELRAQGYSFEEIRQKIVQEGYIDPARVHQYRKCVIEKRISSVFYEGRFIWQGIEYRGNHELIIPPELIKRAREGRKSLKLVPVDAKHGVFSGWMTCAECGCTVIYDPKTKRYRTTGKVTVFHYYHCTNGRRMHETQIGMNISEQRLWEQFDSAVDAVSITPELARQIADALNDSYKRVVASNTREIDECRSNLKALEQREDRAYEDMTAGLLDIEGYRRHVKRIRDERHRLQSQLQAAQSQMNGKYQETSSSILELSKDAKSLYLSRSPAERVNFLKLILSNPVLRGTRVEFNLRKPFSTLALMNRDGEWRTHIDDFRTQCAAIHAGFNRND